MWGFLGSLVGAGASIFGGMQQNKANANLNRTNRRWNAKEQRKAEKRQQRYQKQGERRAERMDIRDERRANKDQKRDEIRAEKIDVRSDLRDEKSLKRAERREEKRWLKYTDPQFLRDRAEDAGFNPLLFTQSAYGGIGGAGPSGGISLPGGGGGGAAGYGGATGTGTSTNPAFTSMTNAMDGAGGILANGFASLDEANYRAEELAMRETALQMENNRLQEVAHNARFGPTGRSVLAETGTFNGPIDESLGTRGASMENAPPRRGYGPYGKSVSVYAPNGQQIQITEGAARRMDVRPGETLEPGVMTEIAGEIIGEGGTLASADILMDQMGYNPITRDEGMGGWGTVGEHLEAFGQWVAPDRPHGAATTGQPGNLNWDGKNDWWSQYARQMGIQ